MKILKEILKYAIIAIIVGVLVAVVEFFQEGAIDVLHVLARTGVLFVILCAIGILTPPLRKLLGYKEKF